ncbi:hypothetical protein [Namhaeicola litoreus]|uniref:Uncharacterized protein n=1 Tax=Namhaeicola litoreus TaxID=1052145 RepID=A0ABW3Y129_9FLAO
MENIIPKEIKPMSPTDWAITVFITSLPLVGLIMLLIWAFGDQSNIHRQNYAKGSLIVMLIGLGLAIIFLTIFGGIALMANIFD